MRNRAALLCFLLSAAPAFAQAKCDSNGTPGNGTDDRAAFQAAFDSVDPLLGGAVLIPAGKICRISDYIHVHASNLTITGGGTLFADPPIVNGQLTFGKYNSAFYPAALQISAPNCNLRPATVPTDATSGFYPDPTVAINNISLHDFTLRSTGGYTGLQWNGQGGVLSNIPAYHDGIYIQCARNVKISQVTVRDFGTDGYDLLAF